MKIELHDLGKRFTHEWIFRGISFTFDSGSAYAILGPNGSGKSTLMQCLAGSLTPTKGTISYNLSDSEIAVEDVFQHVGYCAPYIQVPEEFTLRELLAFHKQFRPYSDDLNETDVLALTGLEASADKEIRYFSSGMKQRVKLILSIVPKGDLLLLDEPATNLDAAGVAWYKDLLARFSKDRIVVVGSNRPEEYDMCTEQLSMADFKQ